MKSMIFWSMAILMYFNIDAFSKTLDERDFSASNINERVDLSPVVLFDIKPRDLDFAFKVAVSSSLLELKEKTQIDNSLISRVAVLMSYRF